MQEAIKASNEQLQVVVEDEVELREPQAMDQTVPIDGRAGSFSVLGANYQQTDGIPVAEKDPEPVTSIIPMPESSELSLMT